MIKILAVDDEPGICDILKKTFAPIGFTVLTATSGQEALSIIKKEKPKIVFLDIRMLGMSGFEVLKEIKRIDGAAKVIMITALNDEKTKEEAMRLGADEFITKPFNSDYLEELVKKEVAELLKPKIMVVDDEEDVRDRLASLVGRKFNCTVEKAASGEVALRKLKEGVFDLVILDIKMPGLSGIDVMRQAAKFAPEVKFLAISGYDSDEIAGEALKAGAVDFIPKPQTPQVIELKVRGILSKIGK